MLRLGRRKGALYLERVLALALAELFVFSTGSNVAVAHCSLDQGYNEENCSAGDVECHEREKARSTDT